MDSTTTGSEALDKVSANGIVMPGVNCCSIMIIIVKIIIIINFIWHRIQKGNLIYIGAWYAKLTYK